MISLSPTRKALASRRSHQARPAVEAVEPRSLMALGHPIVVAALGDSLTDEYTFYGPQSVENTVALGSLFPLPANINTVGRSSAQNWVSNLAATRASQVTFGAYSTVSRGEVRNQGYAEDWARSGTTATGVNADGSGTTFAQEYAGSPGQSLPGLLTQTVANSGYAPNNINVVTILVGGNDYVQGLTEYAQTLGQTDVFDGKTKAGANPINTQIEGSIKAAVTQIHRNIPKAKIILITPPDITAAPVVKSALAAGASVFPDLTKTVSDSVAALDDDLAKFAGRNRVGLINFQSLARRIRKSPTIGGVTVNLQGSGPEITDGFVGDGFHPGSIVQGVLAQAIVKKIDAMSGSKVIQPLTDADIVNFARAGRPSVIASAFEAPGTATQPSVVFQAEVTPGLGNTPRPTGTVTFEYLNQATSTLPASPGAVLGTVPLASSGVASLAVAPDVVHPGSIIAVYNGDEFNDATNTPVLLAPGASLPVGVTVSGPIATSTQLSLTNSGPINFNLDIVVTPGVQAPIPPYGTVTLNFSRHNSIFVPLANGETQVQLPLNQYRNQTVQAVYTGNTAFGPSQSATVPIQ